MEKRLTAHPRYGTVASHTDDVTFQSSGRIHCGANAVALLDSLSAQRFPGFNEAFEDFVSRCRPDQAIQLARVGAAEMQSISAGASLLESALPLLGSDTMRFARAITLIDSHGAILSTTLGQLPGVIFIDSQVSDPLLMAESLFHEALHAKLDAIDNISPLVLPGIAASDVQVSVAWHSPRNGVNQWPLFRAVAAFHVYAHLVTFADAMIDSGTYRRQGRILRTRALFRAHYLGQEIPRVTADDLTENGYGLVKWLQELLPSHDELGDAERYLISTGMREVGRLAGAAGDRTAS